VSTFSLDNFKSFCATLRVDTKNKGEMLLTWDALMGTQRYAIEEIAKIAEDNAAGTEEASAATEEQTASMQEMSASAQELAKTSDTLKDLIAVFKVG